MTDSSAPERPKQGAHHWQFKPGQSGNPSGRPRRAQAVEELARSFASAAINALAASLGDPRTRVAAAVALLDRGYGKPRQSHEFNHHLTAASASDAELLAIALSGNEPPDGVVH